MHYCPRCGENSPFGASDEVADWGASAPLRIPRGSQIVHLDAIGEEGERDVSYGGTRFRVRRQGDNLWLRSLE